MIARMPLVDLELTRLSRRWTTYGLRAFIAAGALLHILAYYRSWSSSFSRPPEEAAERASFMLLGAALMFQWLVVLAVAPMLTAGSIADERRDGTLGTLLLADFRGRDIYFAKLGVAFAHVSLMLLSVLPVLAIAALLGGVDVPWVAAQLVVCMATALAVCTLGLWFSTRAETAMEALFFTVMATSLWLGLNTLADEVLATVIGSSPLPSALTATIDGALSGNTGASQWMPSVVVALVLAVAVAFFTLRALPQAVYAHSQPKKRAAASKRYLPIIDRYLQVEPVARLFLAGGKGLVVHSWPRRRKVLAALGLMLVALLPCQGWVLVTALVCYDVTSTFDAARRSGALDTLSTVPSTSAGAAKSLYGAFLRRSLLFVPALMAPAVYSTCVLLTAPLVPFWWYIVMSFGFDIVKGTVLFFVLPAAACFVATLRFSPALQTCIATSGVVACRHFIPAQLFAFVRIVANAVGSMLPYRAMPTLVLTVLGLWAYYMFRRRLGMVWRNERPAPSIIRRLRNWPYEPEKAE